MKEEVTDKSDKDKSTELLQAVIDWWDDWVSSDNPVEIYDPPIQEIKEFLRKKEASRVK